MRRRRRKRKCRTGKEMVGGKRRGRNQSLTHQSGIFSLLLSIFVLFFVCLWLLPPLRHPPPLNHHPPPSSSAFVPLSCSTTVGVVMEIQSAALKFEPRAQVSSSDTMQKNTPAAAVHVCCSPAVTCTIVVITSLCVSCRARVLFTCDNVRYCGDNQSLELRLNSGLQVLHLQYHLLCLWKRRLPRQLMVNKAGVRGHHAV